MTSGGRWVRAAVELLERLVATQDAAIQKASVLCADAIAAGRLVHLFGTGHCRMPVEEMFPRYGSYPGFHPIVELSMTFHTQVVGANGQRQAMFIERVEGLAEVDPGQLRPAPRGRDDRVQRRRPDGHPHRDGDGRPAPAACRSWSSPPWPSPWPATRPIRRAPACSTTATWSSTCAPRWATPWSPSTGSTRRSGQGPRWPTAAVVNEIKVRTAELLVARDAMPPVLTSAAVVGPDDPPGCSTRPTRSTPRRVSATIGRAWR